jgi:hypothetical protein
MKSIIIPGILLVLIPMSVSVAQLPGDFNCNGTVNGVDATALVSIIRMGLLDSTACYWANGDLNSDGVFHTIADWRQFFMMEYGDTLVHQPPQPANLDTIAIGEGNAVPGDTVSLPVTVTFAEPISDFALQVLYDSTFVHLNSVTVYYNYHSGGYDLILPGHLYWQPVPVSNDTVSMREYRAMKLNFRISNNAPVGSIFNIDMVSGNYLPTGFANVSYPTYFVRPVLIDGAIHVVANPPCNYVPGDANGNGAFNATDVVYMVNYLKGTGQPPPNTCRCEPHGFIFAAADANGDCFCNGIDVTYSVRYLRGYYPSLRYCMDCPPPGR